MAGTVATAATPIQWVEVGPLNEGDRGAPIVEVQQTLLPAFRTQVFGPAKVTWGAKLTHLSTANGALTHLTIEGPFATASAADKIAPGKGPKFAEATATEKGSATITKEVPAGIYRVLGSIEIKEKNPADPELVFSYLCTGTCRRPEMKLPEIAKRLKTDEKLAALRAGVKKELSKLVPDPALQEKLLLALRNAASDPQALKRFPPLPPLYEFSKLRPALDLVANAKPIEDPIIRGDLAELLKKCEIDRDKKPAPLSPNLPNFSYGHFTDDRLSITQLCQSNSLGNILTSLAANGDRPDGSYVTAKTEAGEVVMRSPRDVFDYLAPTHHIAMRDGRMIANFLAMMIDGTTDARIPVWMKTGYSIAGQEYAVPMGHSQHEFRIWGPVVNARVAFYLGISGAGFHPVTDHRPDWTGERAEEALNEQRKSDFPRILKTADYATMYLLRNRAERGHRPADGYGILGVCNDGNAVLEMARHRDLKFVASYPLARDPELDRTPVYHDKLDDLISKLPHDAYADAAQLATKEYRASVLCRSIQMNPHPIDSEWIADEDFRKQLKAIKAELGKDCLL